MTTALHHAIWDGDLHAIDALLEAGAASELLEARDASGNTPLMLALRCIQPTQRAIVRRLLHHGASTHARDARGWTCIQNAVLCDDDRLVAEVFVHAEKQTLAQLTARSIALYSVLLSIPDFYVEIRVELTSWVPLVSKALPSDVLRIWKKGPFIRVDCSLKDFQNTSWKRGHMSHLLRTSPNTRGHVATIDRDAHEMYDAARSMEDPSVADIETGLQLLYTCKTSTFTSDVASMVFQPKKKPLLHLQKAKRRWPGVKYEMLHARVHLRLRAPLQPHWERPTTAPDDRFTKANTFFAKLHQIKKTKKKTMEASNKLMLSDQPMEMHLQVLPGDVVHWHYDTKSVASVAFHVTFCAAESSEKKVVAANAPDGQLRATQAGHAIFCWARAPSSKKKAVSVVYSIDHQRPAPSPASSAAAASDVSENESALAVFSRVPQPRQETTSFQAYFPTADMAPHAQHRALTVLPPESHMTKDIQATVTMAEAFPFTVQDFLPVAQFLSTRAEHFESLRDFFELKLPPGFPTKFQVPILLSVRASYTFEKAEACTVDDSHFDLI
ncbi:hypothetical protein SPRG_13215 [Saprolegnia parasitica CBS 223.65]|uniref:Ankyrin repeat domain-containing protein n=1 Tax=Saprolegnia parasitica (strain CBS 223.65) TaxID=695850 RepID=A0A067BS46_SAPPC|nr:hypothetical protein SPRG_13215 [Saprolegnia parasitica CBS 223.65]KDO21324.1 hypothetical protein SPRG_13215 [Saprolegnia parasitica CBS 223.65]|eukprot:XP_012207979.1 hypothetical protein SPRG_13215 [Saprolegnia parasitica CBS 223.65]